MRSKKRDILLKGKELFWRYGIKRVTIEEICEEAGVAKMTFYKYFSNKNALVKSVLEEYMAANLRKYDEIEESDKPYKEKVKMMTLLKMEGTHDISKEFLSDYYSLDDPDLISFLQTKTEEIMKRFIEGVKEAQARGEVRPGIKPEFIIYFFNRMPDMAADPALVNLYPTVKDLAVELIEFFFHGILSETTADNG
jgi:AcrR family transcriptional regulator